MNRNTEAAEGEDDGSVSIDVEVDEENPVDLVIAKFRERLAGAETDDRIVRGGILHGPAFAVPDETLYGLRESVAVKFGLDANRDVFLVGSAKLGFSIAPNKRYKPFDDESDLDLAIVSTELFKRVWHEVDEYRSINGSWSHTSRFADYLSKGWIRPDKLPPSRAFPFSNEWWEFFRSIQNQRIGGGVQIRAGIYYDMDFLVRYQQRAVSACRDAVRMVSVDEYVGNE